MAINVEKIQMLMQTTANDVEFATALSNEVVMEKAAELDSLMREIQNNVVNAENPTDTTIEYYLMQLTNALYFINTRIEYFGFYEDITKANAKLRYNEAYAENQLNTAANKVKATVADNQLYAENNSVDENMLNLIYSRSVRILKGKVEAAGEMVRTLSKILSAHMNESFVTRSARRLCE
jgi:hypothetical protein